MPRKLRGPFDGGKDMNGRRRGPCWGDIMLLGALFWVMATATNRVNAAPCPEPSSETPSSTMKAEPGCEEGTVLDEAFKEAADEAAQPEKAPDTQEDADDRASQRVQTKSERPASTSPLDEEQRQRQERLERQREKVGEEMERQLRQEQRRRNLARLKALPRAELHIASQPPGAEILVDGDSVQCTTPCQVTGLLAEDHTIELRLRAHVPASRDVFLKPGSRDELTVQLEQTPPRFRVKSRCAGAEATVFVDGQRAAEGKLDGELAYTASAGRHVVRLEARNCKPREESVELAAGQEARDWPVLVGDLEPTLAGLLRTWQGPATHKQRWAMSVAFELSAFATGALPGFAVTPVDVGTDYFRFMLDGGYARGSIDHTAVGAARVGSRMALRIPLAYGALLVGNGVGYRYFHGAGTRGRHSLELPLWGGVELDPLCGLAIEMTGGYSFAPLFVDSAQFSVGIGYSPNASCTPAKTRADASPTSPTSEVSP